MIFGHLMMARSKASPTVDSFTPFPTPTGDVTPTTEQPITPFPSDSGPVTTSPTRRPTGMSLPEKAYLEQFHFVSRPIGKSGKAKGSKHKGKGKGGKGLHRPTLVKSSKKFHHWMPTKHAKSAKYAKSTKYAKYRPQASWMGKSGKAYAWWGPSPTYNVWWGHPKAGKRTRILFDEEGDPAGVKETTPTR